MSESYYEEENISLYHGDCLEVLENIPENSIDLIFADPPYFLSNGGVTCKAGEMVSVNKGDWDESQGFDEDFQFTLAWLKACRRVLKEDGTIWISGTLHNIYKVGFALEWLGYDIINEISWFKPNAPPNLACRYFAHSHETLLWARKSEDSDHTFNYEKMKNWDVSRDKINNQGKQMRSVWSIPLTPQSEKKHGDHPTQKPIELLRRVIASSSNKGEIVLDPFNGSGTTGVVAKHLGREYIGIDTEEEYLDITKKRLQNTPRIKVTQQKKLKTEQ